MNDAFRQEFVMFAKEKLQPAVSGISGQKRSGIIRGLIAGGVCFLIGAAVAYAFLAPYRDAIQRGNIMIWPMVVLAPAALAVLVFSLVFVLSLRKTVVNFRNTLMDGLAGFINSGIACNSDSPLMKNVLEASHLFIGKQDLAIGTERFSGRVGDATVEFSEVAIKENSSDNSSLSGLFMVARYDRAFPYLFYVFPEKAAVSISGLQEAATRDGGAVSDGLVRVERGARQFILPASAEKDAGNLDSRELAKKLDEEKRINGGELYLSARDNVMYLAILSPREGNNKVGIFEGFDIGRCQEFCRDARLALGVARKCGERHNTIAQPSLS